MPLLRQNLGAAHPSGSGRNVNLSGYPDQCPRCHFKQVPRLIATVARSTEAHRDVEESFQCTNERCGGLFIGLYRNAATGALGSAATYDFYGSIPFYPLPPDVHETAKEISP